MTLAIHLLAAAKAGCSEAELQRNAPVPRNASFPIPMLQKAKCSWESAHEWLLISKMGLRGGPAPKLAFRAIVNDPQQSAM